MWELKAYTNCKGSHCEVCGTGITHNWIITDGVQEMRVGTDCMYQYLGISSLKEQKRFSKLYQMANSLYNKRGVNYGDDFKSFFVDYYVNVELLKIKIHPQYKVVHNVWQYYWQPFQSASNDEIEIPF